MKHFDIFTNQSQPTSAAVLAPPLTGKCISFAVSKAAVTTGTRAA